MKIVAAMNDNEIWFIPINEEYSHIQVRFYDSVRMIDVGNGEFEVQQQASIREILDRVKAAGIDNPDKKLEELLSRGRCTATIV